MVESASKWSSRLRGWWIPIGGLVVLVSSFSLLEKLVGPEPTASATGSDGADVAPGPKPPEIVRLEGGGIEIRHDFFRRTTIRLDSEEKEQVLFDCLTQGIERRFAGGTRGWSRARVRDETRRIQDECLGPHGMLASPPGVPTPP
jgi:hypothetical protein